MLRAHRARVRLLRPRRPSERLRRARPSAWFGTIPPPGRLRLGWVGRGACRRWRPRGGRRPACPLRCSPGSPRQVGCGRRSHDSTPLRRAGTQVANPLRPQIGTAIPAVTATDPRLEACATFRCGLPCRGRSEHLIHRGFTRRRPQRDSEIRLRRVEVRRARRLPSLIQGVGASRGASLSDLSGGEAPPPTHPHSVEVAPRTIPRCVDIASPPPFLCAAVAPIARQIINPGLHGDTH
jgi:hypothetical protein